MSDRFRSAFESMLDEMPEPPGWEQLQTTQVAPRPNRRLNGPLVAVAAGVAAVVMIGAVVGLLRGSGDPVATGEIDYVRLQWTQQVQPRCEGMEIEEVPGPDALSVEIFGPTADGLIRVDVRAPDGATHTVIAQRDTDGGGHMWGNVGVTWEAPNRVVDCVERNASFSLNNGIDSYLMLLTGFGPVPMVYGPPAADIVASLEAKSSEVRSELWNGRPVLAYRWETAIDDEIGQSTQSTEWWYDESSGWFVRLVAVYDSEVLGSGVETVEAVHRGKVPLADVDFDTSNLGDPVEIPPVQLDGDESLSTTSVPATRTP